MLHANVGPIDHPLVIFEKEFANKPYQIDVVRTMLWWSQTRFFFGRESFGDGEIIK
jgi:hypothetical protein